MKEFATAARAATDEESERFIEFSLDGEVYRSLEPTPGQTVMIMSAFAEYTTITERVAGTIDYFFGMLDPESAAVLQRRLLARDDPFELAQVTEILSYLMEEWTGRPFTPPSDSSPSHANGGRKSTASARRSESIRSVSGSIGSAT
jgi:hypothetical protein